MVEDIWLKPKLIKSFNPLVKTNGYSKKYLKLVIFHIITGLKSSPTIFVEPAALFILIPEKQIILQSWTSVQFTPKFTTIL